jgi:uncharacterized membrane protein YhhN
VSVDAGPAPWPAQAPALLRRAAWAPFLLVGSAHLLLLVLDGFDVSTGDAVSVSKALLMPALLLAFLAGCPLSPRALAPALLGSLALFFSWLGDISLSVTDGPGFLIGLGFFLLAHLAWITVFVRVLRVRRPPRAAVVYLVWLVVFVALLAPHTGVLLGPVALYGAVLAGVAALGLGAGRTAAWGSALFLASDSLLGLHTFYPGFSPWQIDAVIMAGYLAGQGLIVLGVLRVVQSRRSPGA